jgi:hypothetical protein
MPNAAALSPKPNDAKVRSANAASVESVDELNAVDRCEGSTTTALPWFIQAKLTVGAADDPLEREADRIAERVMRLPVADNGVAPGVKGACCASCAEAKVQRYATSAQPDDSSASLDLVRQVVSGSGRPLSAEDRAFFEPRLGASLADVRIHDDALAAKSADGISAAAYTVRNHVVSPAYPSNSEAGRYLLAHELAHVTQQEGPRSPVRRQPAPTPTSGTQPAPTLPTTSNQPGASVQNDGWMSTIFPPGAGADGILLTDNPEQLRVVMSGLIANGYPPLAIGPGMAAPNNFLFRVSIYWSATGVCDPGDPNTEENCKIAEYRTSILPRLTEVVADLHKESADQLWYFESEARSNALVVLTANEVQTNAEAVKYGITEEQIEKIIVRAAGQGDREIHTYETQYGMKANSVAGAGLQKAAKDLLARRQVIAAKESEQFWTRFSMTGDEYFVNEDQLKESIALDDEIENLKKQYEDARSLLDSAYPVLASFSGLNQGTSDLERVATAGPGAGMAAVVGAHIAEVLSNIATARRGLDPKDGGVNVWRLDSIVDLTRQHLGADSNPVLNALVSEKVKEEQPGIFDSIALAVLNIAAILLAPETGGLSLVAAAGVNAAVTLGDVKEYFIKRALSGSALDKARALSQDEPSLIWLAVEIVGTGIDVGTAAAAAFKTLTPLVKTAMAATRTTQAAESLEAVRIAAEEAEGAAFADSLVAKIRAAASGEAPVVEGLEAETKLLQEAAVSSESVKAAEIGSGIKDAAQEIHISKAGNIFSCGSPCAELGEKYAAVFAKDKDLASELAELRTRAETVSKIGDGSRAAAEADKLAQDVKVFEQRIRAAYPTTEPLPSSEAVAAAEEAGEEAKVPSTKRASGDVAALRANQPKLTEPPAFKDPADAEIWPDYVNYYESRVTDLEKGTVGAQNPLRWDSYREFLGPFRRGRQYQAGVLKALQEDAARGAASRQFFSGMEQPVVESNVGIVGNVEGETTKYADQIVADAATLGENQVPHIEAFSNKSRVFSEWFTKNGGIAKIQQQVQDDVLELASKYGGSKELRRAVAPAGESSKLTGLLGKTVKIDKVTLVYDLRYAQSKELQQLIRDAARLPLTVSVNVVFL